MIGRMLRSADFERVLGTPSRARSPHFAVHYLHGAPTRPRPAAAACVSGPLVQELSTDPAPIQGSAVDDSSTAQVWFGVVVPKRHAKRAVTRNLIKRQIRRAVQRADQSSALPGGLWVVRLRAPFDRSVFTSPASPALAGAAAQELRGLLAEASRRMQSTRPVHEAG